MSHILVMIPTVRTSRRRRFTYRIVVVDVDVVVVVVNNQRIFSWKRSNPAPISRIHGAAQPVISRDSRWGLGRGGASSPSTLRRGTHSRKMAKGRKSGNKRRDIPGAGPNVHMEIGQSDELDNRKYDQRAHFLSLSDVLGKTSHLFYQYGAGNRLGGNKGRI